MRRSKGQSLHPFPFWHVLFPVIFTRQLLCCPHWGLLPAPSLLILWVLQLLLALCKAGCCLSFISALLLPLSRKRVDGDCPQQHPSRSPLAQAGCEGACSSVDLQRVLLQVGPSRNRWILGPSHPELDNCAHEGRCCSLQHTQGIGSGHEQEEEAEEMPPSSMARLVPPHLGIQICHEQGPACG